MEIKDREFLGVITKAMEEIPEGLAGVADLQKNLMMGILEAGEDIALCPIKLL